MIELNLLPEELTVPRKKKQLIKIKLPNIRVMPLAITCIGIFILTHLLISLWLAMEKGQLLRLSREIERLSSQEKEVQELKKALENLNRRFAAISSLASNSLIWSKKLYDLSEAMVDGIWLTSLSLKVEGAGSAGMAYTMPAAVGQGPGAEITQQPQPREVMVLKGSAVSQTPGEGAAIVGKFINSLKGRKDFFSDFEDVKLSSIERRQIGKTEVMDFTIVCYFKGGRSYFEKLEGTNI